MGRVSICNSFNTSQNELCHSARALHFSEESIAIESWFSSIVSIVDVVPSFMNFFTESVQQGLCLKPVIRTFK